MLKIVLIGGPGTGKTSVISELLSQGYFCFEEVSREIIKEAQQKGIDQLFLEDPLLFSKLLLEGREQQFLNAEKSNANLVFFDRGIPDVFAYLNYSNTEYPEEFLEKSKKYQYDCIFHFSPWETIHETDNERYESFEETLTIDSFLQEAYLSLGYKLTTVPFGSIKERTDFILNTLLLLQ